MNEIFALKTMDAVRKMHKVRETLITTHEFEYLFEHFPRSFYPPNRQVPDMIKFEYLMEQILVFISAKTMKYSN